MTESSNSQPEQQLHDDPKINTFLNKLFVVSQGHAPDNKEMTPENRRLEVGTKMSNIQMQRMLMGAKGEADDFIYNLQLSAVQELLKRYPEEKEYVGDLLFNSKGMKRYMRPLGYDLPEVPENKK